MINIPELKVNESLDILAGEAMGAQAAGKLVELNPYHLDELLQNYRRVRDALKSLFDACMLADVNGELAENIDGSILDEASEALK